jgi:hypothetical protein
MKIALLSALLLMTAIRADEHELNENENVGTENPDEPELDEGQKINFLKSFICIIGTDRHMHSQQNAILSHQTRPDFKKRFDKLTANTYRTCMETMDESTMQSFLSAKSREEVEGVTFPGLQHFDHEAILATEEPELSEEERIILENYNAVKKNLEKLQKDNKKGGNKEDDDEEVIEEEFKRGNLDIAGLKMEGATLKIAVIIIMSLLAGVIYFLWNNLFKEPVVKQGKKADKRKKRAE